MNLTQTIDFIKNSYHENIEYIHTVQEKEAVFAELPDFVPEQVKSILKKRGILRLYSHQQQALEQFHNGNNYIITTPTASGKTLGYLLPVIIDKLKNPQARYMFLFPTKALAQDQMAVFKQWSKDLNTDWMISTFDGDTAPEDRRKVKQSGDFILTNPDMLHSGILPHHNSWKFLFENLKAIIIDEMHMYLGIFGSHVSNVFRRLNRILDHYNGSPQFIFSSATIANPQELAGQLTEKKFQLVSQSGAPEGARHYLFYNPPIVNDIGMRQSPYAAAAALGAELLINNIPTIFFARSRVRVEFLVNLLRMRLPERLAYRVRGYRGGYLPSERRNIERGLREGSVLAVVSTNALELGIDIGMLQAVISVGYPGRISSLTQQFGRAGRQKDPSLAVMIATPSALDQYLMRNPQFIFESGGEAAVVHPDNMLVKIDHLKCAAYEMKFSRGDIFSNEPVDDYLEYLAENNVVIERDNQFFWMHDSYPASSFSLRSGPNKNFVIADVTNPGKEVIIGEVDYFGAPKMIHEEAIYMHQGRHYFVKKLLWDELRAEVVQTKPDYFTDAHEKVELSVLAIDEVANDKELSRSWGDVKLVSKAVLFKKLRIPNLDNLGWGNIHTPEIEMHTQGAWLEWEPDQSDNKLVGVYGGLMIRLAYIFKQMAPLVALCDMNDIEVTGYYRNADFKTCALVVYDRYPGGVGLAFKLIRNIEAVLVLARKNVNECPCKDGCPACIGVWSDTEEPMGEQTNVDAALKSLQANYDFKRGTQNLITELLANF